MYGAWIDPQGETIDVEGRCEHERICDYGDAKDEGWIAVTFEGAVFAMSLRLDPVTVTKAALKTAIRLIGELDSPLDISLSDMYTDAFHGYAQSIPQRDARRLLGGVLAGNIELQPNRHEL